ncbi:MAG: HEAT repeat domain-containing protein [Candidatus Hermodarchaeota archaeon]
MHAFQSPQSLKYQFLLEYKDSSPNIEDSLAALNTVRRLDAIDQLRLVIGGLNDKYHIVRAKAIDALTLADASVREHWLVRQKLQEKLNDRSVKVRQKVFCTLGQLKDPPRYLLLRSSMFDRHEKIQDSIGEVFHPYIEWVIQILVDDTKQSWLRSAAAHVLGKIENSQALKVLFLIVKDELVPKYLKRDVKRALSALESQYGKKNEEDNNYSIKNESSNLRPKGNRRYYITSAIKKGINDALLNRQNYPLKWKCPECRGYTTDQLPLAACSVRTNMNIQGYYADIVVLNDNNEPLFVIEVTFTVYPREKSLWMIDQLDIPVFIYWPKPKWTTREESEDHLERLEKGLTGIEGDRIMGYNHQCYSPRHPPIHYPVSYCSHCQHERKLVTLEVWDNYQCVNKKCMSPMLVLKGWRQSCRIVYPGLLG